MQTAGLQVPNVSTILVLKHFSLFHEDAYDRDNWRLRIKGATVKPSLPENCHCKSVSVCTACNELVQTNVMHIYEAVLICIFINLH